MEMFNKDYKNGGVYISENDLKKEIIATRVVLFEKCKPYDYINLGLKYWTDKDGNVIRIDDENCSLNLRDFIGYKGNSFIEAGYVWSPYISTTTTPAIVGNLINSSNLLSRYSRTVNTANYIVCSPEVASALEGLR